MSTVTIDGGYGEGSGALVRTALTMAAITQQGVRIERVRAGSRYPGLDPEDLAILKILSRSTQAQVEGAEIGSNELLFVPTRRPGAVTMEVEAERNAAKRGPNALVVLSTVIPVLARSGAFSHLSVEGETYGHNALGYEVFSEVVLTLYRKFGIEVFPELVRAGFGRDSDGEVRVEIEPSAVQGVNWDERGRLHGLHAIITTGELSPNISGRAHSHVKKLAESAQVPIEIESRHVPSNGPGAFMSIWARYDKGLGTGVAMGTKGLRSEALAQMAFEECLDWMTSDATLDPYLADQALVPAVLAQEPSFFKISRLTQRFLTSVWVVKQFVPLHLTVRGIEGGPGSLSISH